MVAPGTRQNLALQILLSIHVNKHIRNEKYEKAEKNCFFGANLLVLKILMLIKHRLFF